MDPRDVNRINYNNYFVGQNLDFLVRSKMRSESLSTPLKNTPAFYDDQVTSKMSLLGKRGFYDPGYIYGFQNSEEINNNQRNNNEEEYTNPITREQYDQLILPKEHYREQLLHNYEMNNNNNNVGYKNDNDINEEEIYRERERERERLEMMKERQTPQKLDNFQLNRINNNNQINYENPNNINNNKNTINNNNQEEEYHPNYPPYFQKEKEDMELYERMKYENSMVRNRDKIPNVNYAEQINEYNYINDKAKKNAGDLVLPMTKNQILQEVYLENFNRKHSPK